MLRRRGFGAAAEKADSLSMSRFFSLDLSETCLVWICYVEPPSPKFNTLFADWVKASAAGRRGITRPAQADSNLATVRNDFRAEGRGERRGRSRIFRDFTLACARAEPLAGEQTRASRAQRSEGQPAVARPD
jgi:hypothetical protein